MKFVNIKNKDTNLEEFNNLIVVPIKERNKLLEFYHRITGHRNYLILYDKIISDNYYWNNITLSCKNYVKDCVMCNTKNLSLIKPPESNQILCDYPKELYVIDITELPKEYLVDNQDHLYVL